MCLRMAPQPVHRDNVIGGLVPASQPVRKTSGELDEERKQELIMEKKLRACRVSILPKVMIDMSGKITLFIFRARATLSSQEQCSRRLFESVVWHQTPLRSPSGFLQWLCSPMPS